MRGNPRRTVAVVIALVVVLAIIGVVAYRAGRSQSATTPAPPADQPSRARRIPDHRILRLRRPPAHPARQRNRDCNAVPLPREAAAAPSARMACRSASPIPRTGRPPRRRTT